MPAIIIKIININNAIPTHANAGANTGHQDQAIKPIIISSFLLYNHSLPLLPYCMILAAYSYYLILIHLTT